MKSTKFLVLLSVVGLSMALSTTIANADCNKAYKMYLKNPGEHKAMATSGGVPLTGKHRSGFSCSEQGRTILSDAKRAAIANCEMTGRKHFDSRKCLVIFSQ